MARFAAHSSLPGISIVGMAGRFPMAKNIEEFWRNLRDGVESISFFAEEELLASGISTHTLKARNYVKAKGVLDGADTFAATFFGFSPREAEVMDPQHRVLLEVAWEALENAGYDPQAYGGRVGVFAGASCNSYLPVLLSNRDFMSSLNMFEVMLGNDVGYLATRISYELDLKGPSLTLQTACSTSLVAVHLACQSLLNFQCDMALAGGVSISFPGKAGYFYREGGINSPDGHCRAFDAEAQGTVGSDGAGIVVLKRLEDALADGDSIYAVIPGSAVNNDGSMKIGFTTPSVPGQAHVIAEAQAVAGVHPEAVTYIEAHGTGTPLGDPIEIRALMQAFRDRTQRKGYCAIGSVKTNIGHLDAAAGVAGLIKTALALTHRQIPASLHYRRANPEIDFANSPFYVNAQLTEWRTERGPRRAGVSSFGIGGTNAHVVLEEAPARELTSASRPWQLLVLSAKTDSALETMTANLAAHLRDHPEQDLSDIAHTLQVGRQRFSHRRMVVCKDRSDAVMALTTVDPQRVFTACQEQKPASVAFMFPGQGTQYVGMGRELYGVERTFREAVDQGAERLKSVLGVDLRDVLFARAAAPVAVAELLKQTGLTQPALFIIEYALAQQWLAWGVRPEAMIGHSLGEYVAACLAGVFLYEEGLDLVAWRGRLMQQLPGGAMLAVGLPEADVAPLLEKVSLAAVNAPGQSVLSGTHAAVAAVEQVLAKRGVRSVRLATSHAFHSQMMDPILEPLAERVSKIALKVPKIPYLSNVTGTWVTAAEATDPWYWARHLRQTVRFGDGVSALLNGPERLLLEVGPGQTLGTLARRPHTHTPMPLVLSTLPHGPGQESEVAFQLNVLGQLWLAGVGVDWRGFYADERRRRVPLPTYPFERSRYWVEPQKRTSAVGAQHGEWAQKEDLAEWFYVPLWKQSIPPSPAGLERVAGQPLCWLLFCDECGLGPQLAERLRREGQEVYTVRTGTRFSRLASHDYVINSRQREDYDALLSELRKRNHTPHRIIHLWGVTSEADTQSAEFFETSQDRGFYSLLFLAQALGAQAFAQELETQNIPLRIGVVSNNLHKVRGDEGLCPEKATVLGPCKIIPKEYPNVYCRSIDVLWPQTEARREEHLVRQIINEVASRSTDLVVAYRGDHRWVQTFERVRLEAHTTPPPRLRERGLYLITGGLGGIGLVLAEHLARTVHAKLILTGRSPFPARAAWADWLATHGDQDDIGRKIRMLQALERMGAEVLIAEADVANLIQMQEVVRQAQDRFGKIHGVIHAAGVPPGGMIQLKTREMAESVLAPKVQGTRVLDALFKDAGLDFLVLFSSLSAILRAAGRVDYCAANCFLDAFAQRSTPDGAYTVAINWDGWGEVGMVVKTAARLNLDLAEALKEGMSSREGLSAFDRILGSTLSRVVVSMQDFQVRLERNHAVAQTSSPEEPKKPQGSKPAYLRPPLRTAYVAPRNEVERIIAEIWQQVLGIEAVGIYDNFFELGGDSVISLRIVARANQAGLRLSPKQVFEHQRIVDLAAVAGTARARAAEQGPVTGPVSLTPIQRWFFEQNLPAPHHFNQVFMLEARQALASPLLERVVRALLAHHDALRLRFLQEGSDWRQINAGCEGETPFAALDLSAIPEAQQERAIEEASAALHTSLNLAQGPVVRIVLFDLGVQRWSRLLLLSHHLAIDVVSWRILLEDLKTAYQQLSRGEMIQLPPKTTSFKRWTEQLAEYAQSSTLQEELNYWLATAVAYPSRLPRDYADGANTVASACDLVVALDRGETEALLQEVPSAYRTQINDVLLTALVQAFADWAGERSLLVDLEGHGREPIFEELDLSRTVGWFTALYPVCLQLGPAIHPGEALKSVKEQLRMIPHHGFGYGLLRYLNGEAAIRDQLRDRPKPEVSFLYLGQFSPAQPESSPFVVTRSPRAAAQSPLGVRSHLLYISGHVSGGRLFLTWTYSRNIHQRSTIQRLAEGFLDRLRRLILHCRSLQSGGYTPSDFPEAQLSQAELDGLMNEFIQSE